MKWRRTLVSVSKGMVDVYGLAPDAGPPPASSGPEVYTDGSVCRSMGVRRRVLDRLRGEGAAGEDWGFANGEIGMSAAWCARRGLSALEPCGGGGMTFRSVRPTRNPSVVMAVRLLDEVLFPVHVGDASRFRAGMLFEASERDGMLVLSSPDAWRLW